MLWCLSQQVRPLLPQGRQAPAPLSCSRLVFLALLYRSVRRADPWLAVALSSFMIAVAFELTCYYYSFLLVSALLWHKRREVGVVLLAVTAATSFIDWAPTQFLVDTAPWKYLKFMPTWLAEQYTLMSFVTLAGVVFIFYDFGWIMRREPPPPAVEVPAPVPAEPSKSSRSRARRKRH